MLADEASAPPEYYEHAAYGEQDHPQQQQDASNSSSSFSPLVSEAIYTLVHTGLILVAYLTMSSLTSYTAAECPS